MALIPIDQYKKTSPKQQSFGKLKPLAPKPRVAQPVQPAQRPDIRQSANYLNAVSNADKYKQEAQKANSFSGMAVNALKAAPQAIADTLIGTPAKFIASALEAPKVAIQGQYTNKTYKVPGLTPFKSFQSDYGDVAKDVVEGKKGMGSAAWSLSKIPLAGLETGVDIGGIAKGLSLLAKGNIKTAAGTVADTFLPTNFNKGLKPLPNKTVSQLANNVDLQSTQRLSNQGLQALPQKNIKDFSTIEASSPKFSQDNTSYFLEPTIAKLSNKVKPYSPNIMRSGEKSLSNQGQAGVALRDLIKNEQVSGDLQAGKWKSLVQKFTGDLTDVQKNNLTDVLEGKANPIDAQVGASSRVLRNWLNKVQKEAKSTGLDVGFQENYFPRKYNWDDLTKSNRKEGILQHMVDTGQASTKAEADSFLNTFISKNRERKAGNLEFERLYDIPGYEKDPEKALTMYADTAAKRISEAKFFGKKDEISSALINKIAEGGGNYQDAQKVFDYVYKGEPKNAFANFLLGYNTFTKLSLGFFSNLTQSVNTMAKAGLLNTVKGAGQALSQGIKATKSNNYDDLAVLANTLDDHVVMQESGLSNKFIQGTMYLFQKVENFNRRTATYAGKYRAEELANILKADPQSAFATRQLETLGIKVEDIIKGKLSEQQLATAANKMTRITQFKIDALNLPTAWRTPLGKVLSQFKSFSFMQTKFIRDEILKEALRGNLAPLARFLAIAPIASYVTQSARNAVNRVDPNNEKSNPTFRKFDLYRKASGDIPTDVATQLQYAYTKANSKYSDKLGNEHPSTSLLQDIKNFSSPVTGPSVSDTAELLSSLDAVSSEKEKNRMWYANHPAAQSDPYLNLKRFGVTKIPYVGRGLTNTFFNYEPSVAKQAKELMKEGIRTNDRAKIDEAIKQDPYLYNEKVIQGVIGKKIKEMSTQEKALYEEIKSMKKTQPFFTQ